MGILDFFVDTRLYNERKRIGAEMADRFEADPSAYATSPVMGSDPFAGTAGTAMAGDLGMAADAIRSVESNGDYSAMGPVVTNGGMYDGDRAYGAYQVMGRNIPSWTREALGYELTPEEFLADQSAQDAVFQHRFGGYMQDGGFENAASMWHSGRPLDQAQGASDGYIGTPAYVQKAMAAYGGGQQAQQGPSFAPDGSIQRGGGGGMPGPAMGAQHPFGGPQGAVPNTSHLPDPRLPHNFQKMGVEFLRNGYFDEALQVLNPMAKYSMDSNIMRSQYGLNSTLQQEAYVQRQDIMREEQAIMMRREQQQRQFEMMKAQQAAIPRMTPELQSDLYRTDTGISNMEAVLDWYDEKGPSGRGTSPGDKAYYTSLWEQSVLPSLQELTQSGAMQEAELKLFQKWAGTPDSVLSMTGSNRRQMQAVLEQVKQRRLAKFTPYTAGGLDLNKSYAFPLPGRQTPEGTEAITADEARGKTAKPQSATPVQDALRDRNATRRRAVNEGR